MKFEIKHCNNIDSAIIEIVDNKLNIKFAPNGSGKSTIAKALRFANAKNPEKLRELLPFKLRKSNPESKQPEVLGAEAISNILCFDEEYVNQFVFKPDELLNNSFEILIKTEAYKKIEKEIEELIQRIRSLSIENKELEILISTLKEMGDAFKLTKDGISKSSSGMKGLARGNKIQHIPSGLELYKPFIQSEQSVDWIDWQTKGCDFFHLSASCPFCTSPAADKKEQIEKVRLEYDKNEIKSLLSLIRVIEKLGDYFSPEAKETLESITKLKDGLNKQHIEFLASVKKRIDSFTEGLESLRTFSAFHFKENEMVIDKLPAYKLDLQYFPELKSDQMQKAIEPINSSIEEVIHQAGHLQGKINIQKSEIKKTIEQHQTDINDFLSYAGYRYEVKIVGEGPQSLLKLRHLDHDEHLSGGKQFLSFGEKNAFAIVLFMYECIAKKPDLIILDDPISSFDKNKKYAILEMLFRRDKNLCLKNKTVLMLTHDVEPIIDTTKSVVQQFRNQTSSSFLKLQAGKIIECIIEKDDIQPFSQICDNALGSAKNSIVKLIYLRRRFEIFNEKGNAYQVLSNVLKKRERPTDNRQTKDSNGNHPEIDKSMFAEGCEEIKKYLPDFSYENFLNQVKDDKFLTALYVDSENGYEKLQLLRLLNREIKNSVIQKFINETYHIENEFICQLDPSKFDTIPEYVVNECDRILLSST